MAAKVGYRPGNITDQIKHPLLRAAIRSVACSQNNFLYYEAHSGAGMYQAKNGLLFRGSTIHAYEEIKNRGSTPDLWLHEKNPLTRKSLEENTSWISEKRIRGMWQDDIEVSAHYVMDEHGLFFSDPTYARDHVPVLDYVPLILSTGMGLMMYLPEGRGVSNNHRVSTPEGLLSPYELVEKTRDVLQNKKRKNSFVTEVCSPTKQGGALKRLEHLFFVLPEHSTNNFRDVAMNLPDTLRLKKAMKKKMNAQYEVIAY